MKLTFYPIGRESKPVLLLASPDKQLGDAIQDTGLKSFAFEDHILFAEVNDLPGEVAVLRDLLCRELKPTGKVVAVHKKGAAQPTKDGNEENTLPITNQILFYVKSINPGITRKPVPHTAYQGKPLCVIARDGDTLRDAISRDGRFSVDVKLFDDTDRQAEVALKYPVSELSRQTLIMKKSKVDKCSENRKENQAKAGYSSIPENLDDPFTEEIGRAMINNARLNALKAFAKPNAKGTTDHYIEKMVQEFGKSSQAIPARITDTLAVAKQSVGYIYSGDYAATCFLLTANCIITSRHVLREIFTLRSQATDPTLYGKILVHFDYDYPGRYGECVAEIDESSKLFKGQGNVDYAICFLKLFVRGNRPPLGALVRSRLPRSGRVVLVGHPEKEHKSLEVCRVIPPYQWYPTLCKRASSAIRPQQLPSAISYYCDENPNECIEQQMDDEQPMDVDEVVECIHMFQGRYFDPAEHSEQLPYDTSFFHGASGSPVFNSDGHIVAMHTIGYPFMQGRKKMSLMEFGVTFAKIYQDIEEQYGVVLAKHFFPNCQE